MDLCLQETLRMYPPVGIGQAKVCATHDTTLGGLLLPAGTLIAMPHHSIHNVSFNWDAPHEFLPGEGLPCNLTAVLPDNQDGSMFCPLLHVGRAVSNSRTCCIILTRS